MTRFPRARRTASLVAALALALSLAACGDDDGDTASDESSSTSDAGDSGDSGGEGDSGDSGSAADGPVAEWAPVIETDADDRVVGLDFTDTPEPGTELEVATVREGDGPAVEVGQTLSVNYFGSVYQGEEPFDESFSGAPAQFPIGVGQLIPGWDQGIPGVTVGSRIIMSIPSDLGYGDAGSPPTIPGGATLFFVIDVLAAE